MTEPTSLPEPDDGIPPEARNGGAATEADEQAVLQGLYGEACDGGIYHGGPVDDDGQDDEQDSGTA